MHAVVLYVNTPHVSTQWIFTYPNFLCPLTCLMLHWNSLSCILSIKVSKLILNWPSHPLKNWEVQTTIICCKFPLMIICITLKCFYPFPHCKVEYNLNSLLNTFLSYIYSKIFFFSLAFNSHTLLIHNTVRSLKHYCSPCKRTDLKWQCSLNTQGEGHCNQHNTGQDKGSQVLLIW